MKSFNVLVLVAAVWAAFVPASVQARQLLGSRVDTEPTNDTPAGADLATSSAGNVSRVQAWLDAGDFDHFKITKSLFTDPGAFVVLVTPIELAPGGLSTPDTIVEVFAPNNSLIASDDDSGTDFPAGPGPRGSVVRFVAIDTGDYIIKVRGFSGATSGAYLLTVAQIDILANDSFPHWVSDLEGGVPPSAALLDITTNPIMLGLGGSSGLDDIDFASVDLRRGDIFSVSVVGVEGLNANFSSPDIILTLLAPDAVTPLVMSSNDTAGQSPGGNNSGVGGTIRFIAPSTGRYHLRFQSTANGSGFYSVVTSVLRADPNCPGDADGSGTVNFNDITTVLANLGAVCQ